MKKEKRKRLVSYKEYNIEKNRYKKLRKMCTMEKYNDIVQRIAYETNKEIAEYIILSVREKISYDNFDLPKYQEKFGKIKIGRTDFYGYRRLFYHLFDQYLKNGKDM